MGTRVSYHEEIKLKAFEMRLAGVPVRSDRGTEYPKLYTVEGLDAMVSKW